jgi:hypothetical protein
MNTGQVTQITFLRALLLPAVWRKAAPIGLAVGLLQVAVNQGDHWLSHEITTTIIIKSIISPLIGLGLAVVSAAASHQGKSKKSSTS